MRKVCKSPLHYGEQAAALIVGKPGPQLNKNRYVRKPNDATSWLVNKKIDIKHDLTLLVR
jgi:hypothetical protein